MEKENMKGAGRELNNVLATYQLSDEAVRAE